jgi:hypothetical protein
MIALQSHLYLHQTLFNSDIGLHISRLQKPRCLWASCQYLERKSKYKILGFC